MTDLQTYSGDWTHYAIPFDVGVSQCEDAVVFCVFSPLCIAVSRNGTSLSLLGPQNGLEIRCNRFLEFPHVNYHWSDFQTRKLEKPVAAP